MFKRLILAVLILSFAGQSAAAQEPSRRSQIEEQDIRLARIAEQILGANAHLCNSLMPLTGMILHSADQYSGSDAQARFGYGPVAIAAVVPHSPAQRSGVRADDAIMTIGGLSTIDLSAPEDGNLREAAFELLAAQPVDQPLVLGISRDGVASTIVLTTPAGCRTLVEILIGNGPEARSDGKVIQVQFDFARELTDEDLAVVFSHELAHTVLEHRRRKQEAGINNGMLAEVGRNQQANREAEIEADRLSVHLLANAGFDPMSIPGFWRSETGNRLGGGVFNSFVYPSNEARARLVEQEIALYLPQRRGPSWPGHLLALREHGFSSD